jgi:hypothetical protein
MQYDTYLYNFKNNMAHVFKVNSNPNVTFWASGNHFSHLDIKTFTSTYLMPNFTSSRNSKGKSSPPPPRGGGHRSRSLLASDVNWVTAGVIPPVRSQQQCGETWKCHQLRG